MITPATAADPASSAETPDEPEPDDAGEGRDRPGLSLTQLVVLCAALAFLAGAVGYLLGDRTASPPTDDVDVGFLQDMIDHHEQAVTMASLADGSASDPVVRHMAREVLIEQRYEIGLMDGYLQARDLERGDPDRDVMGWMGAPAMPLADMPGLATPEQLDELQQASDDDQNLLFLQLMRAHHLGGIDMADYATRHADDPRVRHLAEVMARVQRSEVREYDLKIEELTSG